MDDTFADTRSRIEYVNNEVYGSLAGELTDWSSAERDQINKWAREEDRDIDLYPVVHCWRTDSGSGLTFWCIHCKTHHTHGRHGGPSYIESVNRWDAEDKWVPRVDAVLPLRLWRRYLQRFGKCTYNPNVPGGRGVCTCPFGSGDGHRVAHCWKRDAGYYDHGYILHEVAPDDPRATVKPKRTRRAT
jgi:hypothetical protein